MKEDIYLTDYARHLAWLWKQPQEVIDRYAKAAWPVVLPHGSMDAVSRLAANFWAIQRLPWRLR